MDLKNQRCTCCSAAAMAAPCLRVSPDSEAGWLKQLVRSAGPVSVDVAAPGVNVLGLGIGGSYVYMTGTSMATPHVTALAAIVLGK